MNRQAVTATIALLVASLIWGVAFIPTRYNGELGIGVFFEILFRYTVPLIIFGIIAFKKIKDTSKVVIRNSIITSVCLFLALSCSIYGVRAVTYGSIGILLISLSVILVPIASILIYKKRVPLILFLSATVSLTAIIILTREQGALLISTVEQSDIKGVISPIVNSATNTITPQIGIFICVIASFGYTAYILLTNRMMKNDTPPDVLLFFQSLTFVVLSLPLVLIVERESLMAIDISVWTDLRTWLSLGYIGLFAGTIAYYLYFFGHKYSAPTTVAVILASQKIFATIADIVIVKITLNTSQIIAYLMIIVATFTVAIYTSRKKQ